MTFLDLVLNSIKEDEKSWNKFRSAISEREIKSKTVLLNEGDIANCIHFIKKGCLRQGFNKDGKDITFQFFFEDQAVASIDSFINGTPSLFSIESIEASSILSIKKDDFDEILQAYPKLKEAFQSLIFQRFRNYTRLFLSRIKDTPRERYEDLVTNHPEIVKRIPQHYIASYLGITAISLSRIRNRKKT
ncbi:Crp/Fnr family transcriptional regulator [Marinifilum sp. D737]|uniref:Crp/Fnr family transcriptional regulator n=1 Tax=Marinifilum sp. D737 TaxID=2969628 RepID=UPI0022733D14|nr:Crp/Fnr family transcriptional regulator [Marinifilum sp. D737]MCY1633784.1 Crp/Fnr family transcriptional regulator [Marinifilum sp. D737]